MIPVLPLTDSSLQMLHLSIRDHKNSQHDAKPNMKLLRDEQCKYVWFSVDKTAPLVNGKTSHR